MWNIVVSGTPGPISSIEEAKEFVNEYGLPIIIKAAMGGRGRGMRAVRSVDDLPDARLSGSKVGIRRWNSFLGAILDKPWHIKVQLLADKEGNVVHLYKLYR